MVVLFLRAFVVWSHFNKCTFINSLPNIWLREMKVGDTVIASNPLGETKSVDSLRCFSGTVSIHVVLMAVLPQQWKGFLCEHCFHTTNAVLWLLFSIRAGVKTFVLLC